RTSILESSQSYAYTHILSFLHYLLYFFFLLLPPPPRPTLFPYTTLFRSISDIPFIKPIGGVRVGFINNKFVLNPSEEELKGSRLDRKSTRLNSSHVAISYAVFCLKKKKNKKKLNKDAKKHSVHRTIYTRM